MSQLIERTVQEIALEHLRRRYHPQAHKGKMFSRIEVRTKKGKRADGLLAYRRSLMGTYVVSMEAKSFKTLPAMQPYRVQKLWMRNSLWMGFLICVFTGGFYAFFKMEDPIWSLAYPLAAFSVSALAYGYFTRNSYRHKIVDVVQQVGQYPANEQWLAFSQDSLMSISDNKRKQLRTICKYQGIGIVVVHGAKGKVEEVVSPKMRFPLPWRDFLAYYSNEQEIRKEIGSKKSK
jgi:hypothetical protein